MPVRLSPRKTRDALALSSRISAELLLVFLMIAVVVWFLGQMWPVVWPVVIALFLTSLTWPLARDLRKRGFAPGMAAFAVTTLFLLVILGILALIAIPMASQSGELADGVVEGIRMVRTWAAGPPLNIGDDQITGAVDTAVARIQSSIGSVVATAASGVATVFHGVVTAVLAVFLMFFFLKDGPRFLPWLARQLPGRLARDVPVLAERSWNTMGAFMRSQALVGMFDAILVGIGLWILDVPLVLPLALLTFVSAFVPIVGAVFAGFVAVLIALVSNGPTIAMIMLVIIVAVQQIEGNVLQPMLQSRGLGLHEAVILLAVTLGGSLSGIVGSLLAVPVTAIVAVVWTYLREQLADASQELDPDGPRPESGSADSDTSTASHVNVGPSSPS
ncbi:AI-2E family transporter [Streptomyces chartreusis]|uniref:AI-2E family transporter n=1 Tax=Streptomyces chartreusis TaxID=1969 RepID=UPI0033D292FF